VVRRIQRRYNANATHTMTAAMWPMAKPTRLPPDGFYPELMKRLRRPVPRLLGMHGADDGRQVGGGR
jgi:hypothetical protein